MNKISGLMCGIIIAGYFLIGTIIYTIFYIRKLRGKSPESARRIRFDGEIFSMILVIWPVLPIGLLLIGLLQIAEFVIRLLWTRVLFPALYKIANIGLKSEISSVSGQEELDYENHV